MRWVVWTWGQQCSLILLSSQVFCVFVSPTSLNYHLNILCRHNLLVHARVGIRRRYRCYPDLYSMCAYSVLVNLSRCLYQWHPNPQFFRLGVHCLIDGANKSAAEYQSHICSPATVFLNAYFEGYLCGAFNWLESYSNWPIKRFQINYRKAHIKPLELSDQTCENVRKIVSHNASYGGARRWGEFVRYFESYR